MYPIDKSNQLSWKPPDEGFTKVNFDGDFCQSTHSYRARVVIRKWNGTFIHTSREEGFADSALVLKCYAARLALSTAHKLGIRNWC